MPGDRHAQPVRLGADHFHQRRSDQAVDLDLLESGAVILPDHLFRFLWRRGIVHAERIRTGAVNKAGKQEARPERALRRDSVSQNRDELELVPHVADGRDPRRQIDRGPLDLRDMGVHVPEAGHQRLPRHVNRRHIVWNRDRRARADVGDAAVPNDDDAVRHRRPPGPVDDRRAGHRVGAAFQRRIPPGDRFEIADPVARRALHELDERRLEVLANGFEAQSAGARDRRRQGSTLVEPHGLAAPDDAVDREALERNHAVGDADRLPSAGLDDDVVGRLAGHGAEKARLAVLFPVPQQHHLRRERRIAVHGEKLRGKVHTAFRRAVGADSGADDRVAALDAHAGVDVHEPVALPFRLE